MTTERIRSASPFEAKYGFCRALRVGDRIEVAGTAPIPQDGTDTPTDAHGQMLLCGRIALDAIERLGGTAADVVRTRMFITDAADADAVGTAHRQVFGDARPVSTMVVIGGLLDSVWKVEIEVEAVVTNSTPAGEVVT
jgi:enamine deaminase RidA (YjgF/YER057c/UK114 family)